MSVPRPDDEKENKKTSCHENDILRIAKELSQALIDNPHLMDELSIRLPTEYSFVLRQLPHDQDAMHTFVSAIFPLINEDTKLAKKSLAVDKIDFFLELMEKPEITNWIMQAITGQNPDMLEGQNSPLWLQKSQQGADLLEERKFEEAKSLLTEALNECDIACPNSLWSFAILRALAVACGGAGDVEMLEPLLNRWISAAESKLGKQHPELAYPYSMMALVREEQGQIVEAEKLYKQAVEILDNSKNVDVDDYVSALHELTYFYYRQERISEAEPLLFTLIEKLDSLDADERNEDDLEEYIDTLIEILAKQSKLIEIEPFCRRLLNISDSKKRLQHNWYPMGMLACSFVWQEKFNEAFVIFESILDSLSQVNIEENDKLTFMVSLYEQLLKQKGRERESMLVHAQAQRLIYHSLEIKTERDEVTSDELPIEIVAQCYYRLSQDHAADQWNFMEIQERENLLREALVQSLRSYFASIDFLKICTDFKDIEENFQIIIENNKKLLGLQIVFQFREFSDKGGFLQVLAKLQRAIAFSDQGKGAEAEKLYEQALVDSERYPRSDLRRYIKEIYIDYLIASGQEEKAEALQDSDDLE